MNAVIVPENPYLLLTPGPLSTTKTVRAEMFRDWCTWDQDYNDLVQSIRRNLLKLAGVGEDYTAALMQGSGTFCVESVIGSAVPRHGALHALVNGAYGRRIAVIGERLGLTVSVQESAETAPPDPDLLERTLRTSPEITHVAVVHCETTTGMLNPIEKIGQLVKSFGKTFIVDAMSSFGGIPMDLHAMGADYLVSSANKCIQGVPGFGFIIARREILAGCRGNARSLSLDLYDQWETMEKQNGKWRFTSPTHTVRAFAQALSELFLEGGVQKRFARYSANQVTLVAGMEQLGFECLLNEKLQSPIITAFRSPDHPDYDFKRFYESLKQLGFVIYPGKVTDIDTFRIGNIGDVYPTDMDRLIQAVAASMFWAPPRTS